MIWNGKNDELRYQLILNSQIGVDTLGTQYCYTTYVDARI